MQWPPSRSSTTPAISLLTAACAAADAADRVLVIQRLVTLHQLAALEAATATAAALAAAAAAGDSAVLVVDSVQESEDYAAPPAAAGGRSRPESPVSSDNRPAAAGGEQTAAARVDAVLRATVTPVDAVLATEFATAGGDAAVAAAARLAATASVAPTPQRQALRHAVDGVRLTGLPVDAAEALRSRGCLGIMLPTAAPALLAGQGRARWNAVRAGSARARSVALSSALSVGSSSRRNTGASLAAVHQLFPARACQCLSA